MPNVSGREVAEYKKTKSWPVRYYANVTIVIRSWRVEESPRKSSWDIKT